MSKRFGVVFVFGRRLAFVICLFFAQDFPSDVVGFGFFSGFLRLARFRLVPFLLGSWLVFFFFGLIRDRRVLLFGVGAAR